MGGWLFGVDYHYTEGAKTYAPILHQPFEQFSPQYQQDYIYAPSVQIDSPGAIGPAITTKKEAHSTPYIGGAEVIAPTTGQPPDIMGSVLLLGLVAVGGYVAVGFLKRKK